MAAVVVVSALVLGLAAVSAWGQPKPTEKGVAGPPDAAAQFQAMQLLVDEGRYQQAASGLREFTRQHAGWERIGDATFLLGVSLVEVGDVSAGKDVLDRLLDAHPDPDRIAEIQFYRGKALEALGSFPEAVLSYDAIVRHLPQHRLAPQAALSEALLCEKILQNPRRAREVYELFVASYPTRPELPAVRNHLALMSEQAGDFQQAVALYRDYAARHPSDPGTVAMNGAVAGAAPALWHAAELTVQRLDDPKAAVAIYQAYEKFPHAEKGRGLMAAARLAAGNAEVGDAAVLFKAALVAAPREDWRMEYARWLRGHSPEEAAGHFLAIAASSKDWTVVAECLDGLGAEGMRRYLDQNPTDFPAFGHYLATLRAADQRAEGRNVLDQWLARGDIEWKTAIATQWLALTGELEDRDRVIRAADAEGRMAEALAQRLAVTDALLAAGGQAAKAERTLGEGLSKWAACPDFPRSEFAARLTRIARLEPMMKSPEPPPAPEGAPAPQPAPESAMVPNPAGKASREKAVALMRKHALDQDAAGADLLAQLAWELDPKAAVPDMRRAVTLQMAAGRRNVAAPHVEKLLDVLPAHDMELVDLLYEVGLSGSGGWGDTWKRVTDAAQAEWKHFQSVAPQTEATRLARARLGLFVDAKQSVAAHDEFLNNHAASAQAAQVRLRRFYEMKRAAVDVGPEIQAAIEGLADNPALAAGIPLEMVPGGPAGYDLYVANATKAAPAARGEVGAELLLRLALLHERFGRPEAAMGAARQLVQRFVNTPQAQEGRRLGVRLFSRGFFPPGLTQADAELAFAWQMDLCLAGQGGSFGELTGPLWRLACHPAYRMHGFEHFDALYLYTTHQHAEAPADANAFLSAMYVTWPGDGIGPTVKLEGGASPFRGGAKFMLYGWGLLRAPVDGNYQFWFSGDDWVGLEIDGQPHNIPNKNQASTSVRLSRGLHVMKVAYGDWSAGQSMLVDWQPPGQGRMRLGPEGFSPDLYPTILSEAALNQGAAGLAQWEAYAKRFPQDARGRMMRLETLVLSDPNRAAGELGQLAGKYPGNLHYKGQLADCIWRLGRPAEAVNRYAELAPTRAEGLWERGINNLYRTVFLGGNTPVDFNEVYQDRMRAASDWNRWLVDARGQGGDDGALRAGVAVADTIRQRDHLVGVWEQAVGRLSGALARERAQLESARALAAKQDAEDAVRAQAREAAERSETRIQELQREQDYVTARLRNAQKDLAALRAAVGLGPDQQPEALPIRFADEALRKNTMSPTAAFELSSVLLSGPAKEAARPFLQYTVERSQDLGQLRWAVDRLVEMAVAGEDVRGAAETLYQMGMQQPRDHTHGTWLQRACDMSLKSGNVFVFARSAQVLAECQPVHPHWTAYLDRLGEVFEQAGNYSSAEYEYRRVMTGAEDPARRRDARLRLARLCQKQGRWSDALVVLSELARLTVPDPDKPGAMTVPPRDDTEPAEAGDDTEALLLAARSYLELELSVPAFDAYERAAARTDFGQSAVPDVDLLMALARECMVSRSYVDPAEENEAARHEALPALVIERARRMLELIDTLFRFHGEQMSPHQKVASTLLRADANIMMRNYPRAVEEVRAAKELAGGTNAGLMADLKMGEIHLATGNPDQALPIFRNLSRLNAPEVSPIALFWEGTTQLKLRRRSEAIESYRKLWEQYGEHELVRQAIYTIARTYAEDGQFLDAIRLYEAVGAINSLPQERVVPGEVLLIRVRDADHNLATGEYTIPVQARSSCGDVEELLLDINKINHSLFLGRVRTELGEPNPGDGILQIYGTDVIYVTYQDRFKSVETGEQVTTERAQGLTRTTIVQVVDDGAISASPAAFVEVREPEGRAGAEKTEEELEEERRLQALSAQLERGQGAVRPGNDVYLRVKDGDLDRSGERDTIRVRAFTYAVGAAGSATETSEDALGQLMAQQERRIEVSAMLPSSQGHQQGSTTAPAPSDLPRLDVVEVVCTETGPHTGVFHGTVKTDVNGPTAIASDTSGDAIAALAIDGQNGAGDAWLGMIDGAPGKWIEIDLKKLHDVARIVWDRGEGADDHYMIDYTVTLRGQGAPTVMERKGNTSAHDNEVVPEEPVTCRWIRFTAEKYEGDAPAISQIQVFDKDGNLLVPAGVSPLERARNDVLEFNVGDCMAAEILDEENLNPGHPVRRTSSGIGVAYVDGRIDAIYLSRGQNQFRGSRIYGGAPGDQQAVYYGRSTKRVRTGDVLQVLVADPDLDANEELNTVPCQVLSSSGDSVALTAREIAPTAAIFAARVQLSPSETARDDQTRLWVRPGDYLVLRYRDEHNRNPGHPVPRESFVFVADDELAEFTIPAIGAQSPMGKDQTGQPANWPISLRDGDLAVPGTDRVSMEALSFATGDKVAFQLLLRDLDGDFSADLPVTIGARPQIALPPGADPRESRRLNTRDAHYASASTQGLGPSESAGAFEIPMAVSGDDIVWLAYEDAAARVPTARAFVPVADADLLELLRQAGLNPEALPEAARTEGLALDLKDPYTALNEQQKEHSAAVLREIARKKRSMKHLLARYQSDLDRIGKRIEELAPRRQSEGLPTTGEVGPAAEVRQEDAPLTEEEEAGGGLEPEDLMAAEDLIVVAGLRRDRDGLGQAMMALRQRLKALAKYRTDEMEAAIDREEAEERALLEQEKEEGEPDEPEQPVTTEAAPAWHSQPDWWKGCGALLPGTTLRVRVADPDVRGESVKLVAAPLGGRAPRLLEVTAKALADQPGVFEASVPTSAKEEEDGALCLDGVQFVMLAYRDPDQTDFPARRTRFLSLASTAELSVTGHDFTEQKERYHLGEDLYMSVRDPDMDKTDERDYVWVTITADTGDREVLAVRESQPHSGVFRGSVPTSLGEPVENDATLSGRFAGSVEVRYEDELWMGKGAVPPELLAQASFVEGTDGTVEVFARQLKRGTLQRDVLFNTGLAKYELGKSSIEIGAVERGRQHLLESRDTFRAVLEQYPDDPICANATYYLGNIEFLLGDYQAAVESLQRVIDRWPKSEFEAKALYKLGTCHMKADELDKAIESFVNLAYHHSDSPLVAEAMLSMAQHFSNKKQYSEAISIARAFISKFPDHEKTGNVYLRTAGWLMVEERLSDAITLLEEAEKLRPDDEENMPAYLYWHADAMLKSPGGGDLDRKRAVILLQRVTYDYPESRWASYARARLAPMDVSP